MTVTIDDIPAFWRRLALAKCVEYKTPVNIYLSESGAYHLHEIDLTMVGGQCQVVGTAYPVRDE